MDYRSLSHFTILVLLFEIFVKICLFTKIRGDGWANKKYRVSFHRLKHFSNMKTQSTAWMRSLVSSDSLEATCEAPFLCLMTMLTLKIKIRRFAPKLYWILINAWIRVSWCSVIAFFSLEACSDQIPAVVLIRESAISRVLGAFRDSPWMRLLPGCRYRWK